MHLNSKESPYASVPNDMFYCHLCKKHMWDANSFENHIKGRTHLMMREGIEESYRLKANMIRQEAKIAEQLKSIELDRLKRMGKTKQRQLEYCTMCDLNFHGHISAHRKSDGHLQLKKFLHPKCVECNKEFATRIDFDSHLLSADHLKKAAEKNTKVGERKRNTLTILTEEEELKDVRQPQKRKKKPVGTVKKNEDGSINVDGVEVKKEPGDDESGIAGEGEDAELDDLVKKEPGAAGDETAAGGDETKEGEDLNETHEDDDTAPPVDADDCILDFLDGDEIPTEVDNRLPKYNWTRPVGSGLITKLECYECSLCGKFFDTEKTVEIHSRTVTHHRNFLKFINEKSSDTKIAQKRAAAALEECERKKRKLEEAETAKNGQDQEMNADNSAESGANAGGDDSHGELYDPSEATGDDDDVEMGENGEGTGTGDGDGDGEGDEDEGGDEELAGDQGDEDMDAQEVDEEVPVDVKPVVVEVVPQPAPVVAATPAPPVVVKTEPKPEVVAPVKTPVKTVTTPAQASTPAASTPMPTPPAAPQITPTSSPMPNQADQPTPGKKVGPRGGGAGKGTPRGRGRGRYNRY